MLWYGLQHRGHYLAIKQYAIIRIYPIPSLKMLQKRNTILWQLIWYTTYL